MCSNFKGSSEPDAKSQIKSIIEGDWNVFYADMNKFVDASTTNDELNVRRVKIDLDDASDTFKSELNTYLLLTFPHGASIPAYKMPAKCRELVKHLTASKERTKQILGTSMIYIPEFYGAHLSPLEVLNAFTDGEKTTKKITDVIQSDMLDDRNGAIDASHIPNWEREELRVRTLAMEFSKILDRVDAFDMSLLREELKRGYAEMWEVRIESPSLVVQYENKSFDFSLP